MRQPRQDNAEIPVGRSGTLYCVRRPCVRPVSVVRRNGVTMWHRHEMLPYTVRFDSLLAELELDPTGRFWD